MANVPRSGSVTFDPRGFDTGEAIPRTDAPLTRSSAVTSRDWFSERGAPFPVGVRYLPAEQPYNFTLYSRNGTRVELLLYGTDPVTPLQSIVLDVLKNRTGRVWHLRLPASILGDVRYYSYSIDGPRGAQHRFDPAKVLLDPYARAVFFPPAFYREAARRPGSNAGRAPLGVIPRPRPAFDWDGDKRPRHTHDSVIYEMHGAELQPARHR